VVSYFLRYFSSTSTEQISPIPPDLSPVSIRLALLFLLLVVVCKPTRRVQDRHYARDPNTLAEYPPADIELAKIGDLLACDLSTFLKEHGSSERS
jgi:hypothetical protein